MDKLSAQSLQIVGDVILEVAKELDAQRYSAAGGFLLADLFQFVADQTAQVGQFDAAVVALAVDENGRRPFDTGVVAVFQILGDGLVNFLRFHVRSQAIGIELQVLAMPDDGRHR